METLPSVIRKQTTKLIRVGHSPDPDDAFMFYALAKEKIPMRGFRVEHVIEDIESLNQRALGVGAGLPRPGRGEETSPLHVTAVSCHAYAYLADQYAVMRSGASVGDQYGPVLVKKSEVRSSKFEEKKQSYNFQPPTSNAVRNKRIAVPGKLTTAYLVLQLYAPDFTPVFMPFDKILDAVEAGEVDLGLIIHEGQITYKERGLEKVLDLGAWWYEKTKLPLPLGVDVIRKDLGRETIESFSQLFKESIQYALSHRKPALEYAIQFGRGIPEDLNDRFVGMYVNDYTVDLGPKGEAGFQRLLEEGYGKGILPKKVEIEFVG